MSPQRPIRGCAVVDAQARSPRARTTSIHLALAFYLPLSSAAAAAAAASATATAPAPSPAPVPALGGRSLKHSPVDAPAAPCAAWASLVLLRREDPILGGSAYEQYFNNGV